MAVFTGKHYFFARFSNVFHDVLFHAAICLDKLISFIQPMIRSDGPMVMDTPPAGPAAPAAGPAVMAKRRDQGLDEMKQYFLRTRKDQQHVEKNSTAMPTQ
jgi:hypothetical protein